MRFYATLEFGQMKRTIYSEKGHFFTSFERLITLEIE